MWVGVGTQFVFQSNSFFFVFSTGLSICYDPARPGAFSVERT